MSGRKNAGFVKRTVSAESSASVGGTGGAIRVVSPLPTEDAQEGVPKSFLYDCAAILVQCPKHNTYGMQKLSDRKGLFFPLAAVFPGENFESIARNKLRKLLTTPNAKTAKGYAPFSQLDTLHYFRLLVPAINEFVTRIIFMAKLTEPQTACCQHIPQLTWISYNDAINRLSKDLWGIEVQILVETYCSNNADKEPKGQIYEMTLREARKHIPKTESTKSTPAQQLIRGAGYSDADVMRLYSEFIQHTFPSQFMNFAAFDDYLNAIGFFPDDQAKKDSGHYFSAFCWDQPWVSFEEFLLGMAAAEKSTPHGGPTAEVRTGYIHRFYDFDSDKLLNAAEIGRLIFDSLRLKKEQADDATIEKNAMQMYSNLKVAPKTPLTLDKLKEAIGSLSLRGTSSLFRSATSYRKCFNRQLQYPIIDETFTSIADLMTGGKTKNKLRCPQCREKKYALAGHSVTLNPDGLPVDPVKVQQEDVLRVPQDLRRMSAELFEPTLPNLVLDWVRDYSEYTRVLTGTSRNGRKPKSYLSGDRPALIDRINQLCNIAEVVFKREPRVIKVQSPCFVFGDIHGNLHDLMLYERRIWRKGPGLEPGSFLFLGDYVDRGPHSLEVVLYLFAFKILAPTQVFLLRGNHEIRSINKSFTFAKELASKLGEQDGLNIWERMNTVFDSMPVCAVIDESIFCAHGGIPTSCTRVEELSGMPLPLVDPESQFPPAHEMLWNDPINAAEYNEYLELLRSQNGSAQALNAATNGFLQNTKRGTAYYFSDEAVKTFLKQNNMTHVIRGHEVCQNGFQFHHKGKLITVFSSSHYGGGLNEAACIFVDQQKLRPIKFDTNT
ncbi:Serine/threonine-protein phosphatase BSL1 -like protein [Halotydeus destructor]|nr:Serine/threonine-protein phosphatase BSL1 -like protein [Halotydeus destructor]